MKLPSIQATWPFCRSQMARPWSGSARARRANVPPAVRLTLGTGKFATSPAIQVKISQRRCRSAVFLMMKSGITFRRSAALMSRVCRVRQTFQPSPSMGTTIKAGPTSSIKIREALCRLRRPRNCIGPPARRLMILFSRTRIPACP